MCFLQRKVRGLTDGPDYAIGPQSQRHKAAMDGYSTVETTSNQTASDAIGSNWLLVGPEGPEAESVHRRMPSAPKGLSQALGKHTVTQALPAGCWRGGAWEMRERRNPSLMLGTCAYKASIRQPVVRQTDRNAIKPVEPLSVRSHLDIGFGLARGDCKVTRWIAEQRKRRWDEAR